MLEHQNCNALVKTYQVNFDFVMDVTASQVYANFRAWVPRNVIPVGSQKQQEWVYYDWGPRSYPEPILFLHGVPGSAESFFLQVTSLAPRGYRVISIDLPGYWNTTDFCDALQSFLDIINVSRIHIYGVGLGGFLAMNYVSRRPERVASILLTHSWLTTDSLDFGVRYPVGMLKWLPDFLVRSAIPSIFPKSVDSASEFAVRNTLSASRLKLATRLALSNSSATVVGRLHFPEERITLIDSMQRSSERDIEISEETARHLPGAKCALLKSGGDLPYITVADEVNMHIIVHLRRHAPAPTEFPTIPPPALLPQVWHFERSPSSSTSVPGDASQESGKDQDDDDRDVEGNDEDAIPQVSEASPDDEGHNLVQKHVDGIAKLREFLPGKDDVYLAVVLENVDGDLDAAIARVIELDKS